MKLYVYETVKYEVINVKFLSKDLPLNNYAIMVKWKCLKFLYSSKGMCRIDSQLKKLIRLKYLILETPYTFFSIFSWYFSFTQLTLYHLFSGINNNFLFWLFQTFFFWACFYNFKKNIFKYFQHWFNAVPSQSTLISQEVFCDYQINLGNTTNLNSSL